MILQNGVQSLASKKVQKVHFRPTRDILTHTNYLLNIYTMTKTHTQSWAPNLPVFLSAWRMRNNFFTIIIIVRLHAHGARKNYNACHRHHRQLLLQSRNKAIGAWRKFMAEGGSRSEVDWANQLRSDDVTGKYKAGDVVWLNSLPEEYNKAFKNAWAVSFAINDRMNAWWRVRICRQALV